MNRYSHAARGAGRAGIALAVWVVFALACAVQVPPSGGPEDTAPPKVMETVPRSDSTGVDPASPIRITFSEAMQHERVERAVTVNPPIEIGSVDWSGNTVIIRPMKPLVRDTTYVVRVRPEYQDRHNVPGKDYHEFAFATGTAALDTARIVGKVTLKRAPQPKVLVRCFRVTGHDTVDVQRSHPDREDVTDRNGAYSLRHLPANGERFIVMAFLDQDANRFFDPTKDPSAVYPDTVAILPGKPVVTGVDMVLIDPREPGGVRGTVTNESGVDTAAVLVALYSSTDSTRIAYHARCDTTGAYQMRNVAPGDYTLRAFVDVKPDSAPGFYPCPAQPDKGCPEPMVRAPAPVAVKPAQVTTAPPVVIPRKEE